MIEFTIPLVPVLIAVAIGGFIGGALIMILFMRQASNFDRARHSVMANEIHQLRERNNDWKDVPRDYLRGKDRWYRLLESILRYKGDIK